MLTRTSITEMPAYFVPYISLVPDNVTVTDALRTYGGIETLEKELPKLEKMGDFVYAEGKWTAKQMLQHIIDAERVFAYRAMRIARRDATPLAGFNENHYVENADVSGRSVADLVQEFGLLRQASVVLFDHLSAEDLCWAGTSSNHKICPLALGFIMCGHVMHHLRVLEQRYYSALGLV